MKKAIIVGAVIVAAAVGTGAADASAKKTIAPEEIQARKEQVYRNTGGFIRKPGSGAGKVVLLDAQDRFDHAEIEAVAGKLGETCHMDVSADRKPGVTLADAGAAIRAAGAKAGVVVAAIGPEVPALVVLPDECCAIVNVAAFPTNAGPGLLRRQVMRGFAAAGGAMTSQFEPTLMSSFSNLKKIEAFPVEEVPADVMLRVRTYLRHLGVTPYVVTTYKHACREGWAPQPTNEVQRVIWEKVKAEQSEQPSNPLKITPGMKPKGK